jgi:hypothetical protein
MIYLIFFLLIFKKVDIEDLFFPKSLFYSYKRLHDYGDFITIFNQMSRLIENKEDLPPSDKVLDMIFFMLPIKQETTYAKIDKSNIAKFLVEFIPKEPISEIKRKAELNDPVSRRWSGMIT